MSCRNNKGDLVAICPFFYGKVRRGFYFLDSLPEGHMTGPLISTEATNTKEILESLTRSVKFSIFDPIVSMMLRVHQPLIAGCLIDMGFTYEVSGLFILDFLKKKPADVWEQVFGKDERNELRYYERGGSSLELARGESDYESFLAILHDSQRHQGYGLLTREFLSSLRSNFGENFRVASIIVKNERVASVGFFCDTSNSIVHWVYVGYSRTRNSRSSNFFAGWRVMNWAWENGFRYVDFGPTSPDPTNPRHRVKKKYGGDWVERYEVRVPVQSRFALPIYVRSRSLARSVINVMQGSRQ
jgi:hypothetical protein